MRRLALNRADWPPLAEARIVSELELIVAIAGTANEPLLYNPAVEQPKPDEDASDAAVVDMMHGILEKTWSDYGHSVRSVHAKSHGLLEGELQVLDGLPEALAQGVFAKAATYPVVLRFSTNPGDILDDTVSSPRGLAMKIIGVEGERLPGSEGERTQDLILVNGPAFTAPDIQTFSKSLKLLAATTDTGQAWKKVFSMGLRHAAAAMEKYGADAGKLKALGGQPMTHPLGETFYTQTPFRYGNYIAKFSVAPTAPRLKALKDMPVDLKNKPNGLRAALIDYFDDQGGEWELRVQLRTNSDTMPIEDASVPWSEDESPYVAVARLTVPPQPAWSEARARQADDGLSFSPWHGITDHQPLGSINRARKNAYAMSAGFRAEHNRCPMHEPSARMELSNDPAEVYGTAAGREGRRPNTLDASPGAWGQPLNPRARKLAAGTIGGLAAGALVSGLMLGMEAVSREPSDLVKLKRRAGGKVGHPELPERAGAGASEQSFSHGGHLALSIAAGAAYGAIKPEQGSPVVAGTALGIGFYALAYGLIGPVLGITPKLQDDTRASIVQHGLIHLGFGIATALIADRVARRI